MKMKNQLLNYYKNTPFLILALPFMIVSDSSIYFLSK